LTKDCEVLDKNSQFGTDYQCDHLVATPSSDIKLRGFV
jgi:hypothetical protein